MKVITTPGLKYCGEYAVLMVLDHLGIKSSAEELINLMNAPDGTSGYHLINAFAHYGINTNNLVGQIKDIGELPNLCLLAIMSTKYHKPETLKGGHWIVYYEGRIYDSSIWYPVESVDAYEELYHPGAEQEQHSITIFDIIEVCPN